MRAASSPAGPPPTTRTFFGTAATPSGSKLTVVSLAAATLTTQLRTPVDISWPTQPMLEPMHGRIRLSSPRRALLTSSGSAMRARTIDTMSAAPLSTMWLAWSRVMIRPTTIVGLDTARVITSLAATSCPRGSSMVASSLWKRQYEPMWSDT